MRQDYIEIVCNPVIIVPSPLRHQQEEITCGGAVVIDEHIRQSSHCLYMAYIGAPSCSSVSSEVSSGTTGISFSIAGFSLSCFMQEAVPDRGTAISTRTYS